MLNVVALLSWYDEPTEWMAAVIASLHRCGVSHIVAVDGAYALFPEARARSSHEQHAAVLEVTAALGMGCTIHTPAMKWYGNEVEKRTVMFRLAEAVTTEDDWLFVFDADEVVTSPVDLPTRLAGVQQDAANVVLWEDVPLDGKAAEVAQRFDWQRTSQQPVRMLFRALRGLHCETNHHTYVAGDGRVLWSNDGRQVEALDLSELRVQHRSGERSLSRQRAKRDYYSKRDRLGIERGLCQVCGEQQAAVHKPTDWQLDEHGRLTSGFMEVCETCAPQVDQVNAAEVQRLGYPVAVLDAGPLVAGISA